MAPKPAQRRSAVLPFASPGTVTCTVAAARAADTNTKPRKSMPPGIADLPRPRRGGCFGDAKSKNARARREGAGNSDSS